MEQKITRSAYKNNAKGKSFAPALCTVVGLLIVLSVIAVFGPMSLQNVLGYQVLHVVSESMEPAIPLDSAVFVVPIEPSQVQEGEVIAFYLDDAIVTHRVLTNSVYGGAFLTQGDANGVPDPVPVDYDMLIGKVKFHVPVMGIIMEMFATQLGKVYALLYLLCGGLFVLLGEQLKSRQELSEELDEELNL